MYRLARIYDSPSVPVLGLPEPACRQCRSEPLAPIDRLIPEPDRRRWHPLLKQRTYTSPYLCVCQPEGVEPNRHDEQAKLRQRVWIVNVDHRAAFYGYLKAARPARALLRPPLWRPTPVRDGIRRVQAIAKPGMRAVWLPANPPHAAQKPHSKANLNPSPRCSPVLRADPDIPATTGDQQFWGRTRQDMRGWRSQELVAVLA